MASIETVSYDPNGLIVDDFPVQTAGATIGTAANLTAGAVLGRITATGKYILSLTGASDGSQTPAAILMTDAAAASADAPALILLAGSVDIAKLTFGSAHTAATVETAFRAAGRPIFLKSRSAA